MKISSPSRTILTAFCSTVAFLLVLLSSQIAQQASIQKSPAQRRAAQIRAEMRLIPVEMRRAVFSKGRWMLQMKNVPFDPDMIIRPRWRERLKPAFARMSEMSAIRREGRLLSGVHMADTLSLPEEIEATGDLLILAREVVFDGPNPVIRGNGNIYLFFIEPPKSRVSTGQLRNSLLRKACFYRSTGSKLLMPSSISWSSALGTWVQGECNLTVNKDGPTPIVFNDDVDGVSPDKKPPKFGVAATGADGNCLTDPNGQRGEEGEWGDDGDDGGNGTAGSNGTHATGAILCDIPDGATGEYEFYARGHRGGKGGEGGKGGDGGDGQKGGKGGRGANCCASLGTVGNGGPGGTGGRGGRAGSGGDGGSGGNGGNGADITVTYSANFSASNITAINTGGFAGGAGQALGPGEGGAGGPDGDGGDPAPFPPTCVTSFKGQPGGTLSNGPSAFKTGNPGTSNGNHGNHGNQTITPRSSSSADDDGDGFSEDDGDCNDDPDQNGASYYPNAPVDCSDFADPEADRNCNGLPDQAEDCPNSPIIINLSGNLKLTSPDDGVDFDIRADGTKIRLSWTSPGSDDSFLALDRNGNGTIDNGAELFGNHTPLGNGQKAHNGFEALGWYDLPVNGGNGNGIIDDGDSVFSTLLVWQDINHNGISEPAELRTLTVADIAAIEVEYHYSRRRDQHGNEYRYRAKVFRAGEGDSWGHKRFAYDIFLASS